FTYLNPNDSNATFLGYRGMAYAQHPEKVDERVPDNCLSIVLLNKREIESVIEMGYMRILTMLGQRKLRFPFPLWNEFERPEPPQLADMLSKTLLSQPIPKLADSNMHVFQDTARKLNLILPHNLRYFEQIIENRVLENGHMTFIPGFDLDGLHCLSWSEKEATLNLLSGEKQEGISEPFKLMGCMLSILGMQDKNHLTIGEDGFIAFLTSENWTAFCNAFIQRKSFSFEVEDKEKEETSIIGFKMEWV
ncbi:MAG: hypothetical protein AAF696_28035, partial [Bacteroidota bacterium]